MIAVDTNILVYAHRPDSPFHDQGRRALRRLAEGSSAWAIPWPCVHEFLAITTSGRRGLLPPSTLQDVISQIDAWTDSPTVTLLSQTPRHWTVLSGLLADGRSAGPAVHDAKIAAICIENHVRELWTADKDFSRFTALATRNPALA